MSVHQQDNEKRYDEEELAAPVDAAKFERKYPQHADGQQREEGVRMVFVNAAVSLSIRVILYSFPSFRSAKEVRAGSRIASRPFQGPFSSCFTQGLSDFKSPHQKSSSPEKD